MQQTFPHLHVVILCDDFGEKLWPLARKNAPVFTSNVGGQQKESLLLGTYKRVCDISDGLVYIVTTTELKDFAQEELKNLEPKNKPKAKRKKTKSNKAQNETQSNKKFEMLVVPEEAGNAFNIAMVSAYIRRKDPQAIVAVFPVNQIIEPDDRWNRLLYKTYILAAADHIAVIGATQSSRCYDSSYIRKSRPIPDAADAYEVGAFVTGATTSNAIRMVSNGALWYTGIYFARAAELLGALSNATQGQRKPRANINRTAEIARFLAQLEPDSWLKDDAYELLASVPKLSYEQAVLEVSDNMAVIPSNIAFFTLSDYSDIAGLTSEGKNNNRASDNVTLESSRQCTVYAENEDKEIKLVGVNNLVVIDTDEGLLISERHQ